MKPRSLKHVLAGGVLIANLACSVTFSTVAILHELHGRRRAFDVMLRGRADSLRASASYGDRQSLPLPPGNDFFEVLNPSGTVLAQSRNVSPEVQELVSRAWGGGYFDFTWNGRPYRALRMETAAPETGDRASFTVLYAASTEDLRHEAVEAAMYYFKVALGILVAITVLLLWFLRSRLAPLSELAERAARVTADSWQFEAPVEAMETQELRPIAISIQNVLQRLETAFDSQKQFTGDAAHELKTSIAILKTRLQLLSMHPRRIEEYEQGMVELLADVRRMEELTAAMLTLARVESKAAEPMESVDLCKVVRSSVERLRPMAVAKGVTVRVQIDNSSHVRMYGMDAEILCSNLIMNALQHSPERSVVTVSVLADGEAVELRVADSGEGIPAASMERLFDRFYRVDPSRSRQSGGAGLGLAICKAIADRSLATIVLNSEAGRGTEVVVAFPGQGSATR